MNAELSKQLKVISKELLSFDCVAYELECDSCPLWFKGDCVCLGLADRLRAYNNERKEHT